MKIQFGIEIPAGHPLLALVGPNIDPQHGGHRMGGIPEPEPNDCAATWTFRNAPHLWEKIPHLLPINGNDGSGQDLSTIVCPKWDVDALVAATVLAEAAYAAYMGAGAQNFFFWGDSEDGLLAGRVELVQKLDSGELEVDNHPNLIGLARVASSDLPLGKKIEICRNWLLGKVDEVLEEHIEKALPEISEGLADAIVQEFPFGIVLIETRTLGKISRGRGASQKLGFSRGAGVVVVIQFSRDWQFENGKVGTKYTLTWRVGPHPTWTRTNFLIRIGYEEDGWGGTEPHLGSFIVGSPITEPSRVSPEDLVQIVSGLICP